MKVIIIEDEQPAADKLKAMLTEVDPGIQVIATIQTVHTALEWLRNQPLPDLAFFDIQLADDVSFEIFQKTRISFPVIFITAYDEYILDALEQNSIDYLLKPVKKARLEMAINKVKKLEHHFLQNKLLEVIANGQPGSSVKKRFIVKKGTDFISIPADQITCFFTEHKIVFLVDRQGTKYITDKNLATLENDLDPAMFFRANRKYIIHIDAVARFTSHQGKIRVLLNPPVGDEVVVSKETAPAFRKWIGYS